MQGMTPTTEQKYSNLIVCNDNGIAALTFNRPKALNALNAETLSQVHAALDEIEADPKNRVLIISGAGEKSFVAGADIRELNECRDFKTGQEAAEKGQALYRRLENSRLIVIAAVNGFALGGGMELSLACDFRIASENAIFGLPEVGLGIIPGYGGTQRLPRLVGRGLALELIATGRKIDAKTALQIGLVNRVVPQAELLQVCAGIAQEILGQAPLAVVAAKHSVNKGMETDLDGGLKIEAEQFGHLCTSQDVPEGMTAFLEKRKANFQGR